MTLAQRLATSLLIVVTTIGAMFVFLMAGGSGTLDLVGVREIYVAMAAITLIPWLAVAVVRPSWRPSSPLGPALLLCIAVAAVSTVTSRVPRLSVEMLGDIVLLIEVYLLLVALMRRPVVRRHLQRLALVLCVLVAVLFVVQVSQAWLGWWDLVGHVAIPPLRPGYLGLTIGPNPVATVVLLLGSFGLAASAMGGPGRSGCRRRDRCPRAGRDVHHGFPWRLVRCRPGVDCRARRCVRRSAGGTTARHGQGALQNDGHRPGRRDPAAGCRRRPRRVERSTDIR